MRVAVEKVGSAFEIGCDERVQFESRELATNSGDCNSNPVGFGIMPQAPNIAQKLQPGMALARPFSEIPQDFEFTWMQTQPVFLYLGVSMKQVEQDRAGLDLPGHGREILLVV